MKSILAVLLSSSALAACATPPLPANITVRPDPVDFGPVFVGETKTMNATLSNGTAAGINALASTLGPGAVFGQTPPALPAAVAAGAALSFPLTFTPPSPGPHQGTWHLTLDRRPYAIGLQGRGVLLVIDGGSISSLDAQPDSGLDFGDVVVGLFKAMEFNIATTGTVAITFNALPTIAPANSPFTVRQPRAAPVTLNPLPNPNSENVKVRFTPPNVGRFTATLTWTSGPHRIKCLLQGNGIAPGGN